MPRFATTTEGTPLERIAVTSILVAAYAREWYGSRSGKRAGDAGENAEVGA
jgi:hypothetical protein